MGDITSRKLVRNTLDFENKTGKVPRQLWVLPWANARYAKELKKITDDFPDDIISCPVIYKEPFISKGGSVCCRKIYRRMGLCI